MIEYTKDFARDCLYAGEVMDIAAGESRFVNVEQIFNGERRLWSYERRKNADRFANRDRLLYRINIKFKPHSFSFDELKVGSVFRLTVFGRPYTGEVLSIKNTGASVQMLDSPLKAICVLKRTKANTVVFVDTAGNRDRSVRLLELLPSSAASKDLEALERALDEFDLGEEA